MMTKTMLLAMYGLIAVASTWGILRHVTIARRRRRAAWREWYRSSQRHDPSVTASSHWSSRV